MINVIFVSAITLIFLGAYRNFIKAIDALVATRAECDASVRFIEWHVRNPGVYVGLSPEGRQLLSEWIYALDRFAEEHPWGDLSEKRMYLMSLFDDLPPKDPNEFPQSERLRKTLVF